MVGEASQIFFSLTGNKDAELLCDATRHKMLPQEFMDWLYQQSSVIMELVESHLKL